MMVKVADFGFSRDICSKDYYRLKRKTRLPVKWLPPESLFDCIYSEKTDVVSGEVIATSRPSMGKFPKERKIDFWNTGWGRGMYKL